MSAETRSKSVFISFEQAVLKTKVAQICEHVGYHSITQDSSNILIDIYRRIIHSIGRHCNESANNNRRVETTLIDLEHAYDFVGMSLSSIQEYIETVKLPLEIKLEHEEQRPSNRIQRNLLVDDLLENEKNSHADEPDEGETKALSESGVEEEEKPPMPLLKDTYESLASRFSDCVPVVADKKIRLGGRIVLVANTKLKISPPVPPEPVPSTSGVDVKTEKKKKKKEVEKKKSVDTKAKQKSPVKQSRGTKGKRKKKISKEFILTEPAEFDKDDEKVELDEDDKPMEIDENFEVAVKKEEKEEFGEFDQNVEKEKELETELLKEELEREKLEQELKKEIELKEKEVKESKSRGKSKTKEKDKGKLKTKDKAKGKDKDKVKVKDKEKTKEKSKDKEKESSKSKDKGKGRGSKNTTSKKTKIAITPLDPAIAEPPSFFPILDAKIEDPEIEDDILDPVQPPLPSISITPTIPVKQPKGKKKKKTNNQFAIVTETVTAAAEDKEWFCPACGGPDDGDLMVQCDTCQEWYHLGCTNLSKPPEDEENWECEICINKAKLQKKPQTPVIVEPVKTKTPEPKLVTPPPTIPPQPATTSNIPQDDLCPECNLPDDGTMMIQCDDPHCARWFHGKCVSLLEEPKEDESWFCKACVEKQQSAFKRRRRAK